MYVFPFERLPPEVRDQMYGLVLIMDEPIKISRRRKSHYPDVKHRKISRGHDKPHESCFLVGDILETVGNRKVDVDVGYHRPVAMVLLTKAIPEEALPILLSSNNFVFQSPTTFVHFLDTVCQAIRFLEDVAIRTSGQAKLRDSLKPAEMQARSTSSLKLISSGTAPVQVG